MEVLKNLLNQEIIDIINSNFEISEVIDKVLKVIAVKVKADRCYFRIFDKEIKEYLPIENEYLADESYKRITKYDFRYKNVINSTGLMHHDENLYPAATDIFNDLNIKSYYSTVIEDNPQFYAELCINYCFQEVALSKRDEEFFKSLPSICRTVTRLYIQSLIIKRKVEKTELLKKIIEYLRSSLDINEIKNNLVIEVGKAFNADRCFIRTFNTEFDSFNPVDVHSEYLKSPDVKSLINYQFNDEFNNFLNKQYKNKCGFIIPELSELEKILGKNHIVIQILRDKFNVKSNYCFPIFYEDKPVAILVVHFTEKNVYLSKEKVDLIKSITDQAGIALTQAQLYSTVKKQAEREKLIRDISNKVKSFLDIKEIKKNIVTEIARVINADRVIVREYNPDIRGYFRVDRDSEYLSSDQVKSMKDEKEDEGGLKWFTEKLKTKERIIFNNAKEFIQNNNLENTSVESLLKKYNIISSILLPLVIYDEYIGSICIDFTQNQANLSPYDIEFIQALVNQLGANIYKYRIYNELKKTAERENLLKLITETIIYSSDIDIALNKIVEHLAYFFKAGSIFITQTLSDGEAAFIYRARYPENTGTYLQNLSVMSHKLEQYWKKEIVDKSNIIAINNTSAALIPEDIRELYLNLGVKSILGLSIKKENDKWGFIKILQYKYPRKWSNDDILFLKLIAQNIYLGIKQVELTSFTKRQAEKEFLLRNILTTIRNTLDINEVKKRIVTEIGKTLNSNICIINQVDPNTGKFLVIDKFSEFRSSEDVYSLVGLDVENNKHSRYFKKIFLEKQEIIAPEWKNYLKTIPKQLINNEAKELIKNLNIKSGYLLPITYADKHLGMLYIFYTQESYKLTDSKLEFLRILVGHLGIALHQAHLFQEQKINTEKERLLTQITSTIKSNLNLNEILYISCNKLLKFYKLDKISINMIEKNKSLKTLKDLFADLDSKLCIADELTEETKDYIYKSIISFKNKIIINDVVQANIPSGVKKNLINLNITSLLIVPLIMHNVNQGIIMLIDNKARCWEQEYPFLERVSEAISNSIKESYIYNQSQFISNVSHELKTPIAIIDGYLDILADSSDDIPSAASNYISIIKNNTERINNLVIDLLKLSSFDKNIEHSDFDTKTVSLNNLIDLSIENCKHKADSRSILINKKLKTDYQLKVNESLIQQALINLIDNAINYSNDNRPITIETLKKNNEVIINVIDKGLGVKEEDIDNIFMRFYRVDKSRSRNNGGTGLGLSIVKEIVNYHNGHIKVQSKYGSGSTFSIHLPAIIK